MGNKQTAVDWLFLMLNDPNRDQEFAKKLYNKAKEIEEDQITFAWEDGFWEGCEDKLSGNSALQYYNSTYGE